MALQATLTLSADGRESIKCKNKRNGQPNIYTAILDGDFGSGTVTAQISFDGSNWVNVQESGSDVTFTADGAKNFELNSDENEPVYLGFSLASSTSPSITIKVYNNG